MKVTQKQLDRVQSIINYKFTNKLATEIAWLKKESKKIIEEKGTLRWFTLDDDSDEAWFTQMLLNSKML